MKIKMGALVTSASGKIGGQFISSDRSGASLRTKAIRKISSVTSSDDVRSSLSFLSRKWRTLTPAQRLVWNSCEKPSGKPTNFGDEKEISGFNYFVSINSQMMAIGSNILLLPPRVIIRSAPNFLSVGYVTSQPTPTPGQYFGGGKFFEVLSAADPLYNPAGKMCAIVGLADLAGDYRVADEPFVETEAWSATAGDSPSNTQMIINHYASFSYAAYAARLTPAGGFSDWCLPARDLLKRMCFSTLPDGMIDGEFYWSSTEKELGKFYVGKPHNNYYEYKDGTEQLPVRQVRFSEAPIVSAFLITLSAALVNPLTVVVLATAPMSAGISNPRSTFKTIGHYHSSSGTSLDITANYIATFGAMPPSGTKIFVKAYTIDSVSGFKYPDTVLSYVAP
jgi:hypothetical protein